MPRVTRDPMASSPKPALPADELSELNERFESAAPEEILGWATTRFSGDTVLTCSFQHEGVAIAHMLRSIAAEVPVVFINTRFHFKETLEYRDTIVKLLGINLREVGSKITPTNSTTPTLTGAARSTR